MKRRCSTEGLESVTFRQAGQHRPSLLRRPSIKSNHLLLFDRESLKNSRNSNPTQVLTERFCALATPSGGLQIALRLITRFQIRFSCSRIDRIQLKCLFNSPDLNPQKGSKQTLVSGSFLSVTWLLLLLTDGSPEMASRRWRVAPSTAQRCTDCESQAETPFGRGRQKVTLFSCFASQISPRQPRADWHQSASLRGFQ